MTSYMPPVNEPMLIGMTQAVIELGQLAMDFGKIDRTCVAHVDGTPESDSDHTVMIGWLAPALAEFVNRAYGYDRYPVGKVAQYALVHDAVEVYAGDTPTHKVTPEELVAKDERENQAALDLWYQFRTTLPWFAHMVRAYEKQDDSCARFVRAVDKIMPKVVHVINTGADLIRAGMTASDFQELYGRQRQQIVDWCPEPFLLQLYDELCAEVMSHYINGTARTKITRPVRMQAADLTLLDESDFAPEDYETGYELEQ